MRLKQLIESNNLQVAYHGSPNKFTGFNTADIFLAKNPNESKRYGGYLYKVTFSGKPRIETLTIMVISPEQVVDIELIEYNPNQKIYRT